jgi:hypothetical protein
VTGDWEEFLIFKSYYYFIDPGMMLKTSLLVSLLWLVTSLIHPGPSSGQRDRDLSSGDAVENAIGKVYESLHDSALNRDAFHMALLGYKSLFMKGLVSNDSVITIIDYTLPSSEDRFFVIDLRHPKVIFKTLVAHGRNSGELYASRFSNRAQSHQSALGFYITGDPYIGGQGYSMLLTGVDTGFNDHARIRSIVVHGAAYATQQYIRQYGRLGRSFGCPALPPHVNAAIIDRIKNGSVIFSYYPDRGYLQGSPVLGLFAVHSRINDPAH